jgi:hypothetical protein
MQKKFTLGAALSAADTLPISEAVAARLGLQPGDFFIKEGEKTLYLMRPASPQILQIEKGAVSDRFVLIEVNGETQFFELCEGQVSDLQKVEGVKVVAVSVGIVEGDSE